VSERPEELWNTLNQRSNLPRFNNPPALELVHFVETHEYQDDRASVIDDTDDHSELLPDSPELFCSCELWIPGVELVCFSSVHGQAITIAWEGGSKPITLFLRSLLRIAARN